MKSITEWVALILCKLLVLSTVQCILNKQEESKVTSKQSDSTKKADVLDAQASHNHGVYGGFGENSLGGYGHNFGGSGLGNYGEGGFDFGEHEHHRHHEPHHYHDHHEHHDHHDHLHKALAIKGLLVPLAGVALLGAAAAFVSNPILLQLGVISGTYGRRRRRDAGQDEIDESAARLDAQAKLQEIQILERFMAQVPKEEMFSQEKKLMASYLSCAGNEEENACHERLACELYSPDGQKMPEETQIMSIVTQEIFNNELVPYKIKERISRAVRAGQESGDCTVYRCKDLENFIRPKPK